MITFPSRNYHIDTHIVLNWLKVNSIEANPCKFQIIILGWRTDNRKITFAIKNNKIKSERELKLIVPTIDEKLTFRKHITNICCLANNKLEL